MEITVAVSVAVIFASTVFVTVAATVEANTELVLAMVLICICRLARLFDVAVKAFLIAEKLSLNPCVSLAWPATGNVMSIKLLKSVTVLVMIVFIRVLLLDQAG